MPSVKLPLASKLDSRDSAIDKDGIVKNAFFEAGVEGNILVVKRPGLNLSIQASGVGLGVYHYGDKTFQFFDGSYNPDFSDVAYGNNLFVAITEPFFNSTLNVVEISSLVSSDGLTWEVYRVPNTTTTDIPAIKFVNGYFYILPDNAGGTSIFRSQDGKSWTTITLPLAYNNLGDIAYGNGTYLLMGYKGNPDAGVIFYKSTNGLIWTHTVEVGESSVFITLTFNGTKFIRSSNGTTKTSSDGTTWTTYTSGISGQLTNAIATNTATGRVVIIAFSQAAYSTDNGVTFTTVSVGSETEDIFFDGTWFVILKTNGSILFSVDGVAWSGATTIPVNIHNFTSGIAGNHSKYIACGDAANVLARSVDLITWTTTAPVLGTSILLTRD